MPTLCDRQMTALADQAGKLNQKRMRLELAITPRITRASLWPTTWDHDHRVGFINPHKERFGVEPICQTQQVAPSTYYAAVSRPPSGRWLRDEEVKAEITRVHRDNSTSTGSRRSGSNGGERASRSELELVGAFRGKTWRTTTPGVAGERPADLVERNFTATAPKRLWVANLS